ncbi:hypothetical protein PBY51_009591 [Eleginops maclovinus]|uniref:Uncharacterized protein n=1 Tax=Eleginops maclovinus TaxID=56733 RepID=A0AAN7XRB7_ELEMC|nr:hypothetical protein PBY51_009591 [Eleginops maclovinus]
MGWLEPQFPLLDTQQPKNSRREDGEPETTLRLARFHQFFVKTNPTHLTCQRGNAARRDSVTVTLRTVHLASGLKL